MPPARRPAFVPLAARGWAELPLPADPPAAAPRRWPGVAVGRDRVLLAGDPPALARLSAAVGAVWPALARALEDLPAPPPSSRAALRVGDWHLDLGVKTYVVAIVNRTPDSFSAGRSGLPTVPEVVGAARRAVRQGADLVDIGAESTAEREAGGLEPEREWERLEPVLRELGDLPAVLSLDTRRGWVAERALRIRHLVVNDVDGLADPALAAVVARRRVPVVVMHPGPVAPDADVVAQVRVWAQAALKRALDQGVSREQVILDAGFGFGTTVEQDLQCTWRLGELAALGCPVLHAPSRKHAIGTVLAFPAAIAPRLPGTAAAVALGIAAGADLVRVHDVRVMSRVARMVDAIVRGPSWRDVVAP